MEQNTTVYGLLYEVIANANTTFPANATSLQLNTGRLLL